MDHGDLLLLKRFGLKTSAPKDSNFRTLETNRKQKSVIVFIRKKKKERENIIL